VFQHELQQISQAVLGVLQLGFAKVSGIASICEFCLPRR
jgi:hypothetical protein